MIENPLFIIDASALQSMFEGKEHGGELLKKMNDMSSKGLPIKVVTPMASFLRALFLTDPETKIQSIQKVLNFIEIGYSTADFKIEKQVTDEILQIAKLCQTMKGGLD